VQREAIDTFRAGLKQLHREIRRPTYRTLVVHAELAGRALHTSTIGDLLNGPGTPRWVTVEAFLSACHGYAEAHRIPVPPGRFALDRWHEDYRAVEAALADGTRAPRPAPVQRAPRTNGTNPRGRIRSLLPAQLPPDLSVFAGRSAELADLDLLLARTSGEHPGASTNLAVISGGAGVGKTALALHWAHRVAPQFPDGQLYVNLRGFGPAATAMDPGEAVRGFLDVLLPVAPTQIPSTIDAQVALYRSLLAGRKILVVLDNARDSDQVRQLLPGAPDCFVVVTSRTTLTGLVAVSGAHAVRVDRLSDHHARDLLASRLGRARVEGEPDAVADLVTACANLPLALSVAAAHAVTRPQVSLAALAADLADPRRRLDALTSDSAHTDVRHVFSWSYHALSEPAARLFRLLGLHHSVDVTAATTASLAGADPGSSGRLLGELAEAGLIVEQGRGRYEIHDLLRVYAAELAVRVDPAGQRNAAVARVLDHYLDTSDAATRVLGRTCGEPVGVGRFRPGVTAETFDDPTAALAWFAAEHRNVLLSVDHFIAVDRVIEALELAHNTYFLDRRGLWQDWPALGRKIVEAADRAGDPIVRSRARRLLAYALLRFDQTEEAQQHLRHALQLAQRTTSRLTEAAIHLTLAEVRSAQELHADGLAHAQQAAELYRRAKDINGQASALNTIGWFLAHLDRNARALECCEQALEIQLGTGNRRGQAYTYDSLGYIHRREGDLARSIACYESAIGAFQELGELREEAESTICLGDAHATIGDLDKARKAWDKAADLFETLGQPSRADDLRARAASAVGK
jgi:tetratricopeptide (TPR) repeat protein